MKLNNFLISKLKKELLKNEEKFKLSQEKYESQFFKKMPFIYNFFRKEHKELNMNFIFSIFLISAMFCSLSSVLLYSLFSISFVSTMTVLSISILFSILLILIMPTETKETKKYNYLLNRIKTYNKEINNLEELKSELDELNYNIKELFKNIKIENEDINFLTHYFNQEELIKHKNKNLLFMIEKITSSNLLENAKKIARKYYY